MGVELDIVESGYYEVLVNGEKVSQHTKENKALSRALEEDLKTPGALVEIKPPLMRPVTKNTVIVGGENNEELLAQIEQLQNEKLILMEEIETSKTNQLLSVSSRITTSKDAEITDADGINLIVSEQDVTITVNNTLDLPNGSILPYKQCAKGNVILTGDVETKQTYSKDDVISIFKNDLGEWEYLNTPKRDIEPFKIDGTINNNTVYLKS